MAEILPQISNWCVIRIQNNFLQAYYQSNFFHSLDLSTISKAILLLIFIEAKNARNLQYIHKKCFTFLAPYF